LKLFFVMQMNELQCMLYVRVRLEEEELMYWKKYNLSKLSENVIRYEEFVEKVLTPFGVKLCSTGPYKQLLLDYNYYKKELDDLVNSQKLLLSKIYKHNLNISNFRMNKNNLSKTFTKCKKIIKQFYIQRIFKFIKQEDLFKFKNVDNWEHLFLIFFNNNFNKFILCPQKSHHVLKVLKKILN